MNEQSTVKEEPAPKKARAVEFVGKVIVTVFWDVSVVRTELAKGENKRKTSSFEQKILFHQENAKVHTFRWQKLRN